MIGLQVDLELVDGTKHLLDVTWGVAYRWQQAHPNTTISEAAERGRLDEMLDLAWEAAKTSGLNPKPIHQWVDEVREVKFVSPKASTTT
jgi:hypothetical protein